MKKINSNILSAYIILVLVGAITSVAGLYIAGKLKKADQIVQQTVDTKPLYPDYEAYKDMHNVLTLAYETTSFSPADAKVIGMIQKNLVVKGKFSRAYLYIEASVDNGKPLTQWDSVFLNLQYSGGHIYRPDSLLIPDGTNTRLLYSLNQIPFITTIPYSDNKKPVIKDWFSLLQNGKTLRFDAFLSSLRSGGKINVIEIRYECETGSDCSISEK